MKETKEVASWNKAEKLCEVYLNLFFYGVRKGAIISMFEFEFSDTIHSLR